MAARLDPIDDHERCNTQPAIEDEDEDEDDYEIHLTVVWCYTKRPERPNPIRDWRMRKPQTDQ